VDLLIDAVSRSDAVAAPYFAETTSEETVVVGRTIRPRDSPDPAVRSDELGTLSGG
jgi:hypothetical protein